MALSYARAASASLRLMYSAMMGMAPALELDVLRRRDHAGVYRPGDQRARNLRAAHREKVHAAGVHALALQPEPRRDILRATQRVDRQRSTAQLADLGQLGPGVEPEQRLGDVDEHDANRRALHGRGERSASRLAGI